MLIDIILNIVVVSSNNSTKELSRLYTFKNLLINYYIILSFNILLRVLQFIL